jgi:hypothetical protein
VTKSRIINVDPLDAALSTPPTSDAVGLTPEQEQALRARIVELPCEAEVTLTAGAVVAMFRDIDRLRGYEERVETLGEETRA